MRCERQAKIDRPPSSGNCPGARRNLRNFAGAKWGLICARPPFGSTETDGEGLVDSVGSQIALGLARHAHLLLARWNGATHVESGCIAEATRMSAFWGDRVCCCCSAKYTGLRAPYSLRCLDFGEAGDLGKTRRRDTRRLDQSDSFR